MQDIATYWRIKLLHILQEVGSICKTRNHLMIMRITWGKLRAGSWQEYEQAYRATVAGKEVPGLQGRWLAQDVNDSDGGFAVSVWESLDAMHAYEQSAVFKQEIQPKLQPFFVGDYTTYRCDVKYEQ